MKCKVVFEFEFYVSSKPVKPKVTCKPISNVPGKLIKSKIACKPRKPVKFSIAFKPVSNVPNKLVKSKFTCKPVSNVSSKYVKTNVLYQSIRSLLSSQILLPVLLLIL